LDFCIYVFYFHNLFRNIIDSFVKKDTLKERQDKDLTSLENMINLIKNWADTKNYPSENLIKI